MVITSHSGPFPATRDLRSLMAGNRRDSIQASQFTIIVFFFTVKNKWREMWAKSKPDLRAFSSLYSMWCSASNHWRPCAAPAFVKNLQPYPRVQFQHMKWKTHKNVYISPRLPTKCFFLMLALFS